MEGQTSTGPGPEKPGGRGSHAPPHFSAEQNIFLRQMWT